MVNAEKQIDVRIDAWQLSAVCFLVGGCHKEQLTNVIPSALLLYHFLAAYIFILVSVCLVWAAYRCVLFLSSLRKRYHKFPAWPVDIEGFWMFFVFV